ncbi:MAG: OmpA family protein [Bradymonadia bacterium]
MATPSEQPSGSTQAAPAAQVADEGVSDRPVRSRAVERVLRRALKQSRARRPRPASPRRAKRYVDRWAKAKAVTPLDAASRRVQIRGDEVELPDRVLFNHDAVTFAKGTQSVMQAAGDLLQASPEVELVLIEGHTDATGPADYNQRLSEARASAVREALIRHGVAPERLVAYGFGETRPAQSNQRASGRQRNRRVVIRLIEADRKALDARAPVEWGHGVVVAARGEARWHSGEAEAAEITLGTSLSEGSTIITGEGELTLRLPDLGVVTLMPHTELTLTKIYADAEGHTHYTAIKLLRGRLRGLSNPRALADSRTLVALPGGSVELSEGRWDLSVKGQQRWLRVDEGTMHVARGGAQSLTLTDGAMVRLDLDDAAPEAVPAPWVVVRPADDAPQKALQWVIPEGHVGASEVEIATDIGFGACIVREVVDIDTLPLAGLPLQVGQTVYWRVVPVFEDGRRGRPSAIYAITPSETMLSVVGLKGR